MKKTKLIETKIPMKVGFIGKTKLKPNTVVNVFLEGRNVNRWVNPDLRYTGVAGNSLSSFNGQIITDENGNEQMTEEKQDEFCHICDEVENLMASFGLIKEE